VRRALSLYVCVCVYIYIYVCIRSIYIYIYIYIYQIFYWITKLDACREEEIQIETDKSEAISQGRDDALDFFQAEKKKNHQSANRDDHVWLPRKIGRGRKGAKSAWVIAHGLIVTLTVTVAVSP
jgi:hypothetical protein